MFCRTTKWLGGLRQIAFLSFPEPQVHSYVYVAILYSGSMSRLWSRYLGLSLGFVFPRDVILDKLIIPFSLHFLIYKMKIIIASNTTGWLWELNEISSVQFSHSVVSDSLWPHGLQHARLPCPTPTPGVYPNSCPLSRWCHPTISSSVVPFSSCPQSFPASGSFQMSQLFATGSQSIGASASTSVLPMNSQDWSPLGWTGWISLQSKGLSRGFSNTTVQKHQFFGAQLSL